MWLLVKNRNLKTELGQCATSAAGLTLMPLDCKSICVNTSKVHYRVKFAANSSNARITTANTIKSTIRKKLKIRNTSAIYVAKYLILSLP
jgi:hypothetical protein